MPPRAIVISRIILCRAMPLSTMLLGVCVAMLKYISWSMSQKEMVLEPTSACTESMSMLALFSPRVRPHAQLSGRACLVVAFCVSHTRLCISAVGQSVDDVAHIPVVITEFLQHIDPLVCNRHLQAVVKSDASL